MIQPINTAYKGYNFRSRLEARWAVFFDSIHLKWQYEPEGYRLPDGRRYLPDFRLSIFDGYGPIIEIKATPPTDEEIRLLNDLCVELVMYGRLFYGPPGDEKAISFHKDGHIERDLPTSDLLDLTPAQYLYAVQAARSARFEHGQKGATL